MITLFFRIEGKGALSSSSNTSTANTNNASSSLQMEIQQQQQHQQQKDKKKNAGITGGSNAISRSKDKKKENHATPMETSDEEGQAMDAMGKSIESCVNYFDFQSHCCKRWWEIFVKVVELAFN